MIPVTGDFLFKKTRREQNEKEQFIQNYFSYS